MMNTMPVVMYPEGIIVGKVRSGRERKGGKVRHIAISGEGQRIGTFNTFNEAKAALEEIARGA